MSQLSDYKIRAVQRIISEQPVNQYETGAEAQEKLRRIELVIAAKSKEEVDDRLR
jgi:hypothetical protein